MRIRAGSSTALRAASSTALHAVLAGAVQPARWLGAADTAVYLQAATSGAVLAVLAHDAVRLPCALVLPSTSAELPLRALVPAPGARRPARVGDGQLRWDGPHGAVEVVAAREWTPARVRQASADPATVAAVHGALTGYRTGVDPERADALVRAGTDPAAQAAAAGALLGRGPGLTPAGDDLLAGYLLGARAFGAVTDGVRGAVTGRAGQATTALSAQLLTHAAHGECVPQVAAAVTALGRPPAAGPGPLGLPGAVRGLLDIGHTSGPALALGLVCAARLALAGPAPAAAA